MHLLTRSACLALTLLLAGCCFWDDPKPEAAPQPVEVVWHDVKLAPFTRINASDNIRLGIKGTDKAQNVRIFGNQVIASVHNDTLFLMASPDQEDIHKLPLNIKVRTPALHDIQLFGNATVLAEKLHNHDLTINDNSTGDIELVGVLGVRHINQYRGGTIKAHWLKSPDLTLFSNSGTVQLAGVVTHLRIKLDGDANLKARNLRADDIWISTKDHAKASITPLDDLQAFATADSEILYHHRAEQHQAVVNQKARILFSNSRQ